MGNDKPSTERRSAYDLGSAFLRNWSIPLFYLVVLVIVYVRFGFLFQFTLGVVWLGVVPIVAYIGKSREFLKNTVFFITLLLSYEALQGVTGELVSSGNVVSLASIDKAFFGFNVASAVQTAFASPSVTLVSTFFYGLHVFLVVTAESLLVHKQDGVQGLRLLDGSDLLPGANHVRHPSRPHRRGFRARRRISSLQETGCSRDPCRRSSRRFSQSNLTPSRHFLAYTRPT